MVRQLHSVLIVTILMLLCAHPVQADEVVFRASVNRNRVSLDDVLRLTISASVPDQQKIDKFELPNTKSLSVIGSTRNESMSFSMSTGRSSQFNRFINTVLTLQPSRAGKVTIGPSVLVYDGKVYKTKAIVVQVLKAGSRAAPSKPKRRRRRSFPDDDWFRSPFDDVFSKPQQIGERDIFIRVFVSPTEVVPGQQVTLSLVIYSRVGARVVELRWPKFDGFYLVDRDVSKLGAEEKYIDGVRYQHKVLSRRALFPLKVGEFDLGPIEVEVATSSSPFFPASSRTLRADPPVIKVSQLPPQAPTDFHATNVGRFSLSAQVDSRKVNLNQPVTFTLQVSGSGNIQNLRPPELPALDKFKVFDPTVDVQVNKHSSQVRGAKSFEYVLLPLSSGKLTIPALSFSFFDTQKKEYQTLKTDPIDLEVIALKGAQTSSAEVSHEVNIVAGAFKPIRFKSGLEPYGQPFYCERTFIGVIVLPPLLYLLVVLFLLFQRILQADNPRTRMRKAWSDARRSYKQAAQAANSGQAADFYAQLKQSLLHAIASKTGILAGGLQLTELRELLAKQAVSQSVIDEVIGEIENCDYGRFAPAASRGSEMSASLERVGKLTKLLQKDRVRKDSQ